MTKTATTAGTASTAGTARRGAWAAGAVLGLASAVETLFRVDGSGADLALALLLGAGAALPLGLATDRRRSAAAAATVTAAAGLLTVVYGGPSAAGLAALACVWPLLAWRSLRRWRHATAERDASLRAFEHTLLELTARGERARIARELHDVVAHHISMISVQAETARLTTPGMPEEGARRLLAIGDTARTALTEMRRLLGVLREDAGDDAGRRPQPGLAQLLELVDEARAAGGCRARLIVRGRVARLDAGVELAAYRIVQEALTNARRHAPGAAVDVEVDYGEDVLRLRVRDNGPGRPADQGTPTRGRAARAARAAARVGAGRGAAPPPGGHGLLGMRERVGTVGGELRTRSAPGGGFLVEARLPTSGSVERAEDVR
ncbi:sensor histidine kinase [Streptomyces sp. 4N509B]|uniref:sensor histidine kinase n=1 Tax=Streptomyces sp. 4N509B TaxID=3457413 RepID=UPI003FD63701